MRFASPFKLWFKFFLEAHKKAISFLSPTFREMLVLRFGLTCLDCVSEKQEGEDGCLGLIILVFDKNVLLRIHLNLEESCTLS